jgi:hypothetical protein
MYDLVGEAITPGFTLLDRFDQGMVVFFPMSSSVTILRVVTTPHGSAVEA